MNKELNTAEQQCNKHIVSGSACTKPNKKKEICQTCYNSRYVTIYENAGFAYKGKPYKIKCPTCR